VGDANDERLAELERLRREADRLDTLQDGYGWDIPGGRAWPAAPHPVYPAYAVAMNAACDAWGRYADAATKAVPDLIAEVRRLRARVAELEVPHNG
jgi:hypothetical protein